jgi:hypothetical protein
VIDFIAAVLTGAAMLLTVSALRLARQKAKEPVWSVELIVCLSRRVSLGLLGEGTALLLIGRGDKPNAFTVWLEGLGYVCLALAVLTALVWHAALHIRKNEEES